MLIHRTISGVSIIAGVLAAAYFLPAPGICVLIAVLSGLAQIEFYAMMRTAGFASYRILGTVFGTVLIAVTFATTWMRGVDALHAHNLQNLVILGTLLAVFVRQFPQKHNDQPIETIGCTLLGFWYVPYLINFFTRLAFAWGEPGSLVRVGETGRSLCLFLILVVKGSDIGAYFTGRAIGRHKLLPRISPGKTWEGLAGGVAAGVGVSVSAHVLSGGHLGEIELDLLHAVVLGCLLPLVGVVGDLFESLLKRSAGVKDSGAMIPGMGGLLDVLDSLLMSAPFLYVYVQVFMT